MAARLAALPATSSAHGKTPPRRPRRESCSRDIEARGEGGRIILVRVMARGGGRENYYRVSFEKGAVDKDGNPAGRAESHHEITDFAIDEILEIIDKIRKREGQ